MTKSINSILLRQDSDDIATLTLNNPAKFNVLSIQMLELLQKEVDNLRDDDNIRVVIINAMGKAFCSGHDLKEMRQTDDKAFHKQLFDQCSQLMLSIHQLPQPVIAAVNGVATAAGCQLVANCDLAVASSDAKFAVSGVNLGLFCSTPAVALSRNLARKHAIKMLLTGEFIDTHQALKYGLINEIVEPEQLNHSTWQLAQTIANKSSNAIKIGKKMFYQQLAMPLPEAYQFASETMACNMDSNGAREGIDAFLEKRPPRR